MKQFFSGALFVSAILFVCGAAFQQQNRDEITAKRIRLVSDDGSHEITLAANNDYAGIWLANNNTGRAVHIYDVHDNQTAVAVIDNYRRIKDHGFEAALFVDQGKGHLQLHVIDREQEIAGP